MALAIDPNLEVWVLAPMGATAAAVAAWRAASWLRERAKSAVPKMPRGNPEPVAKAKPEAPTPRTGSLGRPWPTKTGVASETRVRLPRRKLSAIMYGDKGVVTQAEREVHKLFLGVAGALVTVVCALFILQLVPRVPPSDYLWLSALASGPDGGYIRLAIPAAAGAASAYLTVFKVFRVGYRK